MQTFEKLLLLYSQVIEDWVLKSLHGNHITFPLNLNASVVFQLLLQMEETFVKNLYSFDARYSMEKSHKTNRQKLWVQLFGFVF